MAKKQKPGADDAGTGPGSDAATAAQLASTVKESAQQIWLAGLGAFSKAQEEGGKVFETLVKEGLTIQRRTQAAAEEKLTEASSRMTSIASELSSKASGQWDKLEGIFEQRVSRALKNLGMPASKDIDALVARIEELERTVASLRAGGAGKRSTAGRSAAPGKAAAPKAARKRTTARKAAD